MKIMMRPTFALIAFLLSTSSLAFGAADGVDCEVRVVSNNQIVAQGTVEATLGNYDVTWEDYGRGGEMIGNYAVEVVYEASGETSIYFSRKLSFVERFTRELAPVGGGGGAKFTRVDVYETILDDKNNFVIITAVDQDKEKILHTKCTLRN